jgi:hypothetical protein
VVVDEIRHLEVRDEPVHGGELAAQPRLLRRIIIILRPVPVEHCPVEHCLVELCRGHAGGTCLACLLGKASISSLPRGGRSRPAVHRSAQKPLLPP